MKYPDFAGEFAKAATKAGYVGLTKKATMKNYIINRFGEKNTLGDVQVHVQDGDKQFVLYPAPSQAVHNHSPDGFNFGYGGSGPAQLALAILMDFMGEVPDPSLYQGFKFMFIATLPQETGGVIRGENIQEYIDGWKEEHDSQTV